LRAALISAITISALISSPISALRWALACTASRAATSRAAGAATEAADAAAIAAAAAAAVAEEAEALGANIASTRRRSAAANAMRS